MYYISFLFIATLQNCSFPGAVLLSLIFVLLLFFCRYLVFFTFYRRVFLSFFEMNIPRKRFLAVQRLLETLHLIYQVTHENTLNVVISK